LNLFLPRPGTSSVLQSHSVLDSLCNSEVDITRAPSFQLLPAQCLSEHLYIPQLKCACCAQHNP
jgi:hypothetical protein